MSRRSALAGGARVCVRPRNRPDAEPRVACHPGV